jgi:hypothetical protein
MEPNCIQPEFALVLPIAAGNGVDASFRDPGSIDPDRGSGTMASPGGSTAGSRSLRCLPIQCLGEPSRAWLGEAREDDHQRESSGDGHGVWSRTSLVPSGRRRRRNCGCVLGKKMRCFNSSFLCTRTAAPLVLPF